MNHLTKQILGKSRRALVFSTFGCLLVATAGAQAPAPAAKPQSGSHDPAEPPTNAPHPKSLARPAGRVA
ncbi:MAG TPA: hypothetical protein VGI46_20240, partial [Candidatus Acidoferrum sp.]